MDYAEIEHLGAKVGVTDSRHALPMEAAGSLLIECGPFQGAETSAKNCSGGGRRLTSVCALSVGLGFPFPSGNTGSCFYSPLPLGEGLREKESDQANKIAGPEKIKTSPNRSQANSPLASRFIQAYRGFQPFWNEKARLRVQSGRRPLAFEQLITVDSHSDHQRIVQHLTQTARPAIVIAGNGMCSSGRIVNDLKATLADKRHNMFFRWLPDSSGYARQPGVYVELQGERQDIQTGSSSIGGYFAHADQQGMGRKRKISGY